jgi:hypothetical protein
MNTSPRRFSHAILLAIAVMALSCGRSEDPANIGQRANPAAIGRASEQGGPSEVDRVAANYYDSRISRCGENAVARATYYDGSGTYLVEISKPVVRTRAIPLSEADLLNGLAGRAEAWLETHAVREAFKETDESWSAWRQVDFRIFPVRLLKKQSVDWQVEPFIGEGFDALVGDRLKSGSLERFPCDQVPGHPARLAREQAVKEQERRVAAAAAVEEEQRNRAERARVAGLVAGEWTAPPITRNLGRYPLNLTVTPQGGGFGAVQLEPDVNARRTMTGDLQGNGVLRLTTVTVEPIDPGRRLGDWTGNCYRDQVFLLTLSAEGSSLTARCEKSCMGLFAGGMVYSRQ